MRVSSFPSALKARLEGFGDYASNMLDDVEADPRWHDGDWEKAQLAATADDEVAAAVIVVQDDNLALGVSVYTTDAGLDDENVADLVLNTTAELMTLCEK